MNEEGPKATFQDNNQPSGEYHYESKLPLYVDDVGTDKATLSSIINISSVLLPNRLLLIYDENFVI
jgi:hypothetical protein